MHNGHRLLVKELKTPKPFCFSAQVRSGNDIAINDQNKTKWMKTSKEAKGTSTAENLGYSRIFRRMNIGELRNLPRPPSVSRPIKVKTDLCKKWKVYFLYHLWMKIFHLKSLLSNFQLTQLFYLLKLFANEIVFLIQNSRPTGFSRPTFTMSSGGLGVPFIRGPPCYME